MEETIKIVVYVDRQGKEESESGKLVRICGIFKDLDLSLEYVDILNRQPDIPDNMFHEVWEMDIFTEKDITPETVKRIAYKGDSIQTEDNLNPEQKSE